MWKHWKNMWACRMWKSEAYQNLLIWAPRSYIFQRSPRHFTLSTPYFAVGGAVDPCQCWQQMHAAITTPSAPPPPLPHPTKPVLHFMPPSHHYLHICQHPLCGQEATALLQRVCDEVCVGGRVYFSASERDGHLSQWKHQVCVLWIKRGGGGGLL